MTLGQFIKAKRVEAGLGQKDVADHMGWISPQLQSNLERDVSQPPRKTLKRFCDFLNIEYEAMKDYLVQDFLEELEECFR